MALLPKQILQDLIITSLAKFWGLWGVPAAPALYPGTLAGTLAGTLSCAPFTKQTSPQMALLPKQFLQDLIITSLTKFWGLWGVPAAPALYPALRLLSKLLPRWRCYPNKSCKTLKSLSLQSFGGFGEYRLRRHSILCSVY